MALVPDACDCSQQIQGSLTYQFCSCKKQWEEANRYCSDNFNGHLASIYNDSIQSRLADYLISQGFEDTWVGAKGVQDDWHWITGRLVMQGQGCYRDDPSDLDLPFEIRQDRITPGLCVDSCRQRGYTYAAVQGGYMCYCGNEFGRHGATSDCNTPCSANGNLYCGGYSKNYIYNVNGLDFDYWAFSEPQSGRIDDKECLSMSCQGQNGKWQWMSQRCSRRLKYLCEIDYVSGACPHQSAQIDVPNINKCVLYESSNFTTWFEARLRCQQQGGKLLEDVNEDMHSALQANLGCWQDLFWIGASKVNWTWASGQKMVYSKWATATPTREGNKCVAMSYRLSSDYKWSDQACNQALFFICQNREYFAPTPQPPGRPPVRTTHSTTKEPSTSRSTTITTTESRTAEERTDPPSWVVTMRPATPIPQETSSTRGSDIFTRVPDVTAQTIATPSPASNTPPPGVRPQPPEPPGQRSTSTAVPVVPPDDLSTMYPPGGLGTEPPKTPYITTTTEATSATSGLLKEAKLGIGLGIGLGGALLLILILLICLRKTIKQRIRRHRQRKAWKKEYLESRQSSNNKTNGFINDGFLHDDSVAYVDVNRPEYYSNKVPPAAPKGYINDNNIKAKEFTPEQGHPLEFTPHVNGPNHDPRVELDPRVDPRTESDQDHGTLKSNSTGIVTDSESQSNNRDYDVYESDYDLKQFDQPGFIGDFEAGEAQYINPRDEKEEMYAPRPNNLVEQTGTTGFAPNRVVENTDILNPGAHGTDINPQRNPNGPSDDNPSANWPRQDDTVSTRTSLSTATLPISSAYDDTASTVFNNDTYIPSFSNDAYIPQDILDEEVSTRL